MTKLGDARHHFWLTIGMSRRLGVDLNEEIRNERLDTTDYTDMVTRCQGCAWADNCESWLKSHPGASAAAPEACVNREVWERLRAA